VRPFQDKDFRAILGKDVGGNQTVVARPDDDRVVVRHAELPPDPVVIMRFDRTMSHLTYLRQW
jgi:hypothetical protein